MMPPNDEIIVKKIIDRYSRQKTSRSNFEAHWQQLADLMHPFNDNFSNEEVEGEVKTSNIYDSTPCLSNQLLGSGLFSMLTSPAQKWFEYLAMSNELRDRREVKLWFDAVTGIAFHEINVPGAGFNTAVHECYMEYGAFGNQTITANENPTRDGLMFQSLPLSECYYEEGHDGYVNVLFRRYNRTVRQLVAKFGRESVSDKVLELYDKGEYSKRINCTHAIFPSSELAELPQSFPYAGIYVDVQHKHLLEANHYFELPFMATRFYKSPHETYGRGPGSIALPDIKMLNEIMRTTLRAAQKAVDPPLMVPDDGFLAPIRTTAGGLNFYRSGFNERVEPMAFGSDPRLGFDIIEGIRSRIREIFYVDQLQLQEGPQMTATEVMQRTEEKLRLMGPLMGRLKSEFLGPLLTRVFRVLLRMGKFPPMPEILRDQDFRVAYTSPIARAQEQTEANGIMRAMSVLTPFIEMQPDIMDNFNSTELAHGVTEMFSVSPKYLNGPDQVKAIRDARKKQADDAQTAENMNKAGQGIESMSRAAGNLQAIEGGAQ